MGKISVMIGSVVNGNPEFNRCIKGENFNTIEVNFRGTKIKVLFSTYVCTKSFATDTKVKVVGSLMSFNKSREIPEYYIYANSIEEVDLDEETTNLINFSITVSKVKNLTISARCNDMLPLVGNDRSPLNTVSVIYLCVRDIDARRLRNKEKGYTIRGTGYLKRYRDIYEILVKDIENMDKLCPQV